MSTVVVNPSKLEPTTLSFRTSMGCTASLMPERFRDKLESTVHTLPVFSPDVARVIALDAQAVAAKLGVTCRGASLKTDDVLVSSLSRESREKIHKALHDIVLPYAMSAFPDLGLRCSTVPSDKNLFVVKYSGSGGRPSLNVHKDQVPLTVNITLSAQNSYVGGGTYFPARVSDYHGIVLRPEAGTAIMHDGNVEHAGHKVTEGTRLILVCFFEGHAKDPASSPACPLANSATVGCTGGSASRCCHKAARKLPKTVFLEELVSSARLEEGGRPGAVSLGMVAPAAFSGFASPVPGTALHGGGMSGAGGAPHSPGRSVASGVSNFLARAASSLPALLGQCSLPLSLCADQMHGGHCDLPTLLHRCKLDYLVTILCKEHHLTLLGCLTLLEDSGRVCFMRYLQRLGVSKLADRQTLTNALSKFKRDQVLRDMSAPPPCKKCETS